jgi:ABC-type branched-subunit amino acid transport system permease subunit
VPQRPRPLTGAPLRDSILLIEQILNGLQFGLMLFLISAGLTLIFGVMGIINLAHGSLYMVGAFAAAAGAAATGSFVLGAGCGADGGRDRGRDRRGSGDPPPV